MLGEIRSQVLAVPMPHELLYRILCIVESLLLGSLLWSLGIMCLFTLPSLTLSNLESVEEKAPPGNLAQR
ncbi:hypothetical protein Q3G72_019549 [Acer saccharum]|nr:hypothetical protein Q3G72_019549 [Acer saccharum]